jgi:hypothetical protein
MSRKSRVPRPPKPRSQQLSRTLSRCKGGPMRDRRRDAKNGEPDRRLEDDTPDRET